MKRRVFLMLCLTVALASLLVPAQAMIWGIVTDAASGLPIDGAVVTQLTTGETTTTAGGGWYYLSAAVDGAYNVAAADETHFPKVRSVVVTDLEAGDQNIALQTMPAPIVHVYDNFAGKADGLALGSTASGAGLTSIPWIKGFERTSVHIAGGQMVLDSGPTESGVALNGTFKPANIDVTVKMTIPAPSAAGWAGGLMYRAGLANTHTYFASNQGPAWVTARDDGYLIYIANDGTYCYLFRGGANLGGGLISPALPVTDPNFKVRVRAFGPHHEVWAYANETDGMAKIVDVYDLSANAKNDGGFVGIPRWVTGQTISEFDLKAYKGQTMTVTGQVKSYRLATTNGIIPPGYEAYVDNGPLANAKLIFRTNGGTTPIGGQVITTDGTGHYTAEIGCWGKTTVQVIADGHRQATLFNMDLLTVAAHAPTNPVTTPVAWAVTAPGVLNLNLGQLPDVNNNYFQQVPSPRWDTFSRIDTDPNAATSSSGVGEGDLGIAGALNQFADESGTMPRGDAAGAYHRGYGYSRSWEAQNDAPWWDLKRLIGIKNQKMLLPHADPSALQSDQVGQTISFTQCYPNDGDFSFSGISEGMTEPGDYVGIQYRAWHEWFYRGYAVRCFADGTAKLTYSTGRTNEHGYYCIPQEPSLVKEVQLSSVLGYVPDWTKEHQFRVKFIGANHKFWIDGKLVWDLDDWMMLENGYIGAIHRNAAFYTDNWMLTYDKNVSSTSFYSAASSVLDAKTNLMNKPVTLSGPVVTGQYDGFFYVEDPSTRLSGLKVISSTVVGVDNIPTISGMLAMGANGEAYISATAVSSGSTAPNAVKPLGMTNKSNAPVVGLSNLGLLSTVWGKVIDADTSDNIFMVDDGSGKAVKVQVGGTLKPADGQYATCIGVSGLEADGTPIIYMRGNDDLQIL